VWRLNLALKRPLHCSEIKYNFS